MRPHVASRVLVLSSVSLAQAAAFNPRYERNIGNQNLADAVEGVLDLLGDKKTVTETMIHTITVGAAPAGGAGLNATSGVTMTVTAPASTATPCPGQAQGAVQGAEGGNSTSAPPAGAVSSGAAPVADVPHGGIGVKIIPVPSGAGAAGPVANPPAVSQPSVSQPQPVISQSAAPSGGINTTSTLAPLPSQPGLIQPPGVSTTSSEQSLSALPSLQTPPGLTSSAASSTIGGAPTSSTSASTSASTLGRLPDLPSSLAPTINLGAAGAAVATPPPNPGGAFGGIVGMIPIGSATRPPVANGTGTGPTINVSGLKLTSRLTLGDLVKPTGAAAA